MIIIIVMVKTHQYISYWLSLYLDIVVMLIYNIVTIICLILGNVNEIHETHHVNVDNFYIGSVFLEKQ